jgi:hypothetical protein
VVRERQDLVEEWQKRDRVRMTAASNAPGNRDQLAEAANVSRLSAVDARLTEIDKRLAADFPDYVALARPLPLTVEEVQSQLGSNEALVLFLDTDDRFKPSAREETFIWVITNSDMRWVKSELGTPALTREVSALRCGLDPASWEDDGAAKCASLLKVAARKENAPLPFDVARAHALYDALFGQLEDLIKDKQLLIVPSGPLTALPFQVLVTAAISPSPSAQGEWEYGLPLGSSIVTPSLCCHLWRRSSRCASSPRRARRRNPSSVSAIHSWQAPPVRTSALGPGRAALRLRLV